MEMMKKKKKMMMMMMEFSGQQRTRTIDTQSLFRKCQGVLEEEKCCELVEQCCETADEVAAPGETVNASA